MTETRLTTHAAHQTRPAIWGNYVVFEDNRMGQIDIYLYDTRTQASPYRISRDSKDDVRPDICEDRIVWERIVARDPNPPYSIIDSDIYMYDLSADTDGDGIPNYRDSDRPAPDPAEMRLTDIAAPAPGVQKTPRVSERCAVWDDRRGVDGESDIYVYEFATGLTTVLSAPSYQVEPTVWGGRVVWSDFRNGLTTGWDIYMYDVDSGRERPICTALDHQSAPTISGDRVAWEDLRISGGLPDPKADIFMLDLITDTEYAVVSNDADQLMPILSHDWMTWVDDRRSTPSVDYYDVYMYDFRTAREWVVVANDYPHSFPDAYWNRIVYQDNRYGNYDLFMATFSVSLPKDWSLISIPLEPADPSPHGVLGTEADNALYRWDMGLGTYIVFDPLNPGLFGDMRTGEGYWLVLTLAKAFDYSGTRYTRPKQLSLPTADWYLIGPPFDLPVNLADCKFENTVTHQTLTFNQAYQQGWIRQPLYYFDPFMDGYFTSGTGVWHRKRTMWPWYGYWLNTRVPDLRMLIPVPSIADNGPPVVGIAEPPPGAVRNPDSILTQWTINNDEVAWSDVRMDGEDWTYKGAAKTHTFTNVTPGDRTIYVRVIDYAGNIGYASVAFRVNNPPTAAFVFTPPDPAPNQTVQFTDQSSDTDGTVLAWSWQFGDGGASTVQNPTHKYTLDGVYNATLTVTDNNGGTGFTEQQVNVGNLCPVIDAINYTPQDPTDLDDIEFTGVASDPDGVIVSWQWTFGDGGTGSGQVVSHRYSDNGVYTVSLTVRDDDGCIRSSSVQVPVANVAPQNVDFSWTPTQPCRADTVSFTGAGTDADGTIFSWAWNFGDGGTGAGQTTSHKYAASGSYSVVLTVTDNDGASTTKQHTVVVVNCCPENLGIGYTPASPTDLDTITFTGSAIDRDGTIASWAWDFGDGSTGSGKVVTHKYADDGTYTVKMTVTDNDGCVKDKSVDVVVANVPPTGVGFTWTPAEPSHVDVVAFQGSGTDPDGSIVSWEWDLGDPNCSPQPDCTSATGQQTTHQYAVRDTYTVVLTVTDDDGAVTTAQNDVVVANAAPENLSIQYDPPSPAPLDTVTFTGQATDRDGTVEGWDWDFGDGGVGSGQQVTHQYADNGEYTVVFTATDNEGKSAFVTALLVVGNRLPVVDFTWTPAEPCAVDTITFNGTGTDPDGTIVSWAWDFGDGGTGSGQTATHKYAARNTYAVVFTATDDDGGIGTAQHDVVVANAAPDILSVSWTPRSFAALETVTFTGSATDRDGFISLWVWDFGDGNNAAGQVVTHQYADSGPYTVRFTATDNEGKSTSITVLVGNQPPIASFIYRPAYPAVGQEVKFFDTSVDPDGEIVARDWSFGDGATGHGARPRHTYAQAGIYVVTLTVTDSGGATATASASIDLTNAPPTAAFTWTPPSPTTATVVQFTDTSTDSDGSVVAWTWYFGDGSAASTSQNPTHQYSQVGTYWVSLQVADDDGATSTLWQSVTVTAP